MTCLRASAAWCLVFWLGASPARAESISRIVVFGDSLSDCGNVFEATAGAIPAPPYYQGRFSNGPVWVERLAARLGVPVPLPSALGGLDYAYGGAETGTGFSSKGTPNLLFQASLYRLEHQPARSDMFVVWGGANDLFTKIDAEPPPDVTPWVANLSQLVRTLSDAGAGQFLVANLPPLGHTPWLRLEGHEAKANEMSVQFNAALAAELKKLRTDLGVTIYGLDTYGLFTQAIANPAAFGLANTSEPAFDAASGNVVPNPHEYMFWDDVHPTAAVHAALGDWAAAAVPEPSVAVLSISGVLVAGMGWRRRRARHA